jgi:hypothetical protein
VFNRMRMIDLSVPLERIDHRLSLGEIVLLQTAADKRIGRRTFRPGHRG